MTERGYILGELLLAIVVVGVVAVFAYTGPSGQLRHVAGAFAETRAGRLAAGRLEELRASAPAIAALERHAARDSGAARARPFALDARAAAGLVDPAGLERVRRIEPGLLEVEVEVSFRPAASHTRRRVVLTTLVDVEAGR